MINNILFRKPLVICVVDVRVEASQEALASLRAASKSTSATTTSASPTERNRKLISLLNWLQYVAVQVGVVRKLESF